MIPHADASRRTKGVLVLPTGWPAPVEGDRLLTPEVAIPLFMDRHEVPGATPEELAEAHASDLEVAPEFGVKFFSYWYDEDQGSAFCFARAPNQHAMRTAHERSHGLVPSEIITVSEEDVVNFLGNIRDPVDPSEVESPFRVIAFTDLVDSTKLLNELGQTRFMSLLDEHDAILGHALTASGGKQVKHTGDGIMASFSDCPSALDWSLDVRASFDRRADMSIRVGLAAGEPVAHHRDLFGAAVNQANRICDAAAAGKVLVSDVVHDKGAEGGFEFGGPTGTELKGFPGEQTIYELLGRQSQTT